MRGAGPGSAEVTAVARMNDGRAEPGTEIENVRGKLKIYWLEIEAGIRRVKEDAK